MDNDCLNLAIRAFHQHNFVHARELLSQYVNYNRKDAQGWLWYSRVQESRPDKLACLHRAYALDPNDTAILAELEHISGHASLFTKLTAPPPPAMRSRLTTVRLPARASTSGFCHSHLRTAWLTPQTLLLLGALALFLVALFSVLPMFFGSHSPF